ncbi:MAG: sigma-70 family RNA polymerase sigma factor [Paracoccaceae bacterium]
MSHEFTKDLVALTPVLMRRASRLANNQAEAEDMVQDTLLKLHQRLEDGAEIQDLRAYGMRTLSNRAQRYWRARFGDTLKEDMASIDPDAPLRLDCADALAAIATLPEHQREIMRWIVEGETSPQILSDRTGLPVGTIMSRLARARATLRILLHEDNA